MSQPTAAELGAKVPESSLAEGWEDKCAGGHSWAFDGEGEDATCTTGGSKKVECSQCGSEATVTYPALGHKEILKSNKLDPATCTTAGKATYTCANGCTYSREETIPALGHALVYVAAQPATCTEDGYTEGLQCQRCGNWYDGHDTIPAKGGTCSWKPNGGNMKCENCGDTKDCEDAAKHATMHIDNTCTKCGYAGKVDHDFEALPTPVFGSLKCECGVAGTCSGEEHNKATQETPCKTCGATAPAPAQPQEPAESTGSKG